MRHYKKNLCFKLSLQYKCTNGDFYISVLWILKPISKKHSPKHVEHNDTPLLVCCLNSQQHFSHILTFSQHPHGLYNLQQKVQDAICYSYKYGEGIYTAESIRRSSTPSMEKFQAAYILLPSSVINGRQEQKQEKQRHHLMSNIIS